MKKVSLVPISLLLLLCLLLPGCGGQNGTQGGDTDTKHTDVTVTRAPAAPTTAPTAKPEKITEQTDYVTEQWVATDIVLTATEKIKRITDTIVDGVFVNRATGTTMTMPAFWNGKTEWIVRFAPTECGIWDLTVKASGQDIGLDGQKATLAANPYEGDLAIYQHGFVKTQADTRYFVYNDGVPFFYFGDTHWGMLKEEFDTAGDRAGSIQTDSHFKYIVDKRVEQGFTVYQSEPIGAEFKAADGIGVDDIAGFKSADRYFAYIAEKGLVHANAELLYATNVTERFAEEEVLYAATRYWVARYAAYPVLWTLAQEVDNSRDGIDLIQPEHNVFVRMCEIIAEVDPYRHPITAHQENTYLTTVTGGVGSEAYGKRYISQPSCFRGVTGHTWWGVQWKAYLDKQFEFKIPMDYWNNGEGKVTINYETRYENLGTKTFGAVVAGWLSFFNGMYGYGYGAQDIWNYKSDYGMDKANDDGIDKISIEDKSVFWSDCIEFESVTQIGYMCEFLQKNAWWKLIPDFNEGNAYAAGENKSVFYACAHDGNEVIAVYFYNRDTQTDGKLVNLEKNAAYKVEWFDVRTGTYTTVEKAMRPDAEGTYAVPQKPSANDAVLLVTMN